MIPRLLLFLFFVFFFIKHSFAQWSYDPTINNALDTGQNKADEHPDITRDGNGGFFITWDKRLPSVYGDDVYAQHIDSNGVKLWPDTGVVISNAPSNQYSPKIVSDGKNGAIIVWMDDRNGFGNIDIYAQRVNSNGAVLWTNNGVPVFNSFSNDQIPEAIGDKNGGVIVTSTSFSSGGSVSDVYAQRIDSNGLKLWSSNGVVICNTTGRQEVQKIVTDGSGGAIIAWEDYRNSSTNNVSDVYAQRIDSNGNILWPNNGISICSMPYDQTATQMSSDNQGGAYLAWEDFRNSTSSGNEVDVFAQHIDGLGGALWTTDGIPVCTAQNVQGFPKTITCDNGDMMVVWSDSRGGVYSVYAQRFNANGTVLWASQGIPICTNTSANDWSPPFVITDKKNGAFILWEDYRTGIDNNIYAQHVSESGASTWTANGIPVCIAPRDQYLYDPSHLFSYDKIISDNKGGIIAAWQDDRNDFSNLGKYDIYYSKLADIQVIPGMRDITLQCENSPNATAKLENPPDDATITITEDGLPLNYSASDSSFEYFTQGTTTPGTHSIAVKYTNLAGESEADSSYNVTPTCTSPVTLLNFKVTISDCRRAILTWQTAQELNNKGFEVEESPSAFQFQSVHFVQGGGNSNNVRTYSYTENALLKGQTHFRLKQVDFDGHYLYSQILSVKNNCNEGITIFPSPVNDVFYIEGLAYSVNNIKLINSAGVTVSTWMNTMSKSFDIHNLPKGVYILVINANQNYKILKN